jgi:hypothetical protein
MIKSFVAASVLTLALAGPALAQGTITGAPADNMPLTQTNPSEGGAPTLAPHHRRHVYGGHVARRELQHPSGVAQTAPKRKATQP